MADLSITAANVIAASGASQVKGTAGAAITAGQVVYVDSSNEVQLVDVDNLPVGGVSAVYMALNDAADGQPLFMLKSGNVALGSVLTAGTAYYASDTAGGIGPAADQATGDDVILLGIATSGTNLKFQPIISGVTL